MSTHTHCTCVGVCTKLYFLKIEFQKTITLRKWERIHENCFFYCQTKLSTRIALRGNMPFFSLFDMKTKMKLKKKNWHNVISRNMYKKNEELNHINYFNRFYYPIEFECTFYAWSVYVIIIHCFFVWKEWKPWCERKRVRVRVSECVYTKKFYFACRYNMSMCLFCCICNVLFFPIFHTHTHGWIRTQTNTFVRARIHTCMWKFILLKLKWRLCRFEA